MADRFEHMAQSRSRVHWFVVLGLPIWPPVRVEPSSWGGAGVTRLGSSGVILGGWVEGREPLTVWERALQCALSMSLKACHSSNLCSHLSMASSHASIEDVVTDRPLWSIRSFLIFGSNASITSLRIV